jgi:glyoxylate utilization-related uncharacterized protein
MPGGTDVLVMVTCGVLALTVEGQSSQLEAGSAGRIPSGASYIVANPARADTTFVLVYISPAARRAWYTRPGARPAGDL